jgi:DNA (cytosine-5)-methyltransferase 1
MNKIDVIDFFCGCGGTSAGLKKSGMNILAGIDIDSKALSTFERNFPEATAIRKSVVELEPEFLKKTILKKRKNKLLLSACAPCQPFSTQNRLKSNDDTRITLLDEFHRFVKFLKPDYIILENVPGIQKVTDGPFTKFTKLLDQLGYQFDCGVKNAVNYGVPQSRKRLVLLASKKGEIKLPEETYGEDMLPYVTLEDVIKKYHPLEAGKVSSHIPNHACAGLADITRERLKHTPEGGDRRHWPEHLLLNCHKKHSGHSDVYGRLRWNKPSVTLTTKCTSISNGRFGHPEQERALSVREAAAIQTFDDDFIFVGSLQDTARQVGNAVPVSFAKALGDEVISHEK